jgi:hypothetical protein
MIILLIIAAVPMVAAFDIFTVSSQNLTNRTTAIRSQRDVSTNVTIDQISTGGISLTSVLFKDRGYTTSALEDMVMMLAAGAQTLVVDLYWNESLRKFQICPVPFDNNFEDFVNSTVRYFEQDNISYLCEVGLSIDVFLEAVMVYVQETDTTLNGNLIVLLFNLYSIGMDRIYDASLIGTSNDTLSGVLQSGSGSKLYTPTLLSSDKTYGIIEPKNERGYPGLGYFLFQEKKRVIGATWEKQLAANTTYNLTNDQGTLFNSTFFHSFTPLDETSLLNFTSRKLASWRFAYDSDSDEFTTESLADVVLEGYSPIVSHSISTDELTSLLNSSLWSWAPNEPLTEEIARANAAESGDSLVQAAFRCAAINQEGKWEVANCYDMKVIACRGEKDFDWVLSKQSDTYFNSDDKCSDIEGNYTFSVPKTSLEQKYLRDYIKNKEVNGTVWIDMNSIAISNCWVTGGPYASCPYQKISSHRNFVSMLTPATMMTLLLLVFIFLLRFRKVPVQKNRKHWRRIEREKSEGEYEGVPS